MGSGSSRLIVPGTIPVSSESTAIMLSMAPAAEIVCASWLLLAVRDTSGFGELGYLIEKAWEAGVSAKVWKSEEFERSWSSAVSSAWSPSGVEVAWQLTWSIAEGGSRASMRAWRIARKGP